MWILRQVDFFVDNYVANIVPQLLVNKFFHGQKKGPGAGGMVKVAICEKYFIRVCEIAHKIHAF